MRSGEQKKIILSVEGMTCQNCADKIFKKLSEIKGVTQVDVHFVKEQAFIAYRNDIVREQQLIEAVEQLGYTASIGKPAKIWLRKCLSALQIVFLLYILQYILNRSGLGNLFNVFPTADEHMALWVIFFVGLFTSLHCVSMCGGLALTHLSKVNPEVSPLKSNLLYHAGRLISYTIIGGIIGGFGSILQITNTFKSIVFMIAGLFMLYLGLSMFKLLPPVKIPLLGKATTYTNRFQGKGPFIVGLLNGLMPCGPLQAMQLYALSTGSILAGSLSLLVFGLGTVPLMLGFGTLFSFTGQKTAKIVMPLCAGFILIMGATQFVSGLELSGITIFQRNATLQTATLENSCNIQSIDTQLRSRSYESITVEKGIPVKWTIHAEETAINSCNFYAFLPEYDIEVLFEPGDNIIEFFPEKEGTYIFSCWMGMIRNTVTVIPSINN